MDFKNDFQVQLGRTWRYIKTRFGSCTGVSRVMEKESQQVTHANVLHGTKYTLIIKSYLPKNIH